MEFDQNKCHYQTEDNMIDGEIVNEWTKDEEVIKKTSFFDSICEGVRRLLNRIRQDNRSLIMSLVLVSVISCFATSTVVRYKSNPVYKIESYSQTPFDYYYEYGHGDDLDSFFFDSFGNSSFMMDEIEDFLNEIFGGSFETPEELPFSEDGLQEF